MSEPSPFIITTIRLFVTFRILFNARFYYPVFTILFLDYGLSIEQFAILNAVWAATIVCAEIPSGALADLLGRRRLLILTSATMICEMSLIAFVPLANITLVFWAFLCNRVLSGLAEAMASGADEAIAYDALIKEGNPEHWPRVLAGLMRLQALAGVAAMTIGALVYDPATANRLLSLLTIDLTLSQQTTMRFPIYLTLVLAVLALLTTMRLQESPRDSHATRATIGSVISLIVQAGRWIATTPLALAIIIFGMFYDHLLRLIITLASQYFRLIDLPEASFGIIMASFSLLGLVVPKLAQWLVDRFSAAANCCLLGLFLLATLWGLTGFFPRFGVVPMAAVMIGLLLTGFFTSHYLNRITASAQRATVLSFKGLVFNLAYGLIGLLFALLIRHVRDRAQHHNPALTADLLEHEAFRQAFAWFPWYALTLMALLAGLALLLYRHYRRTSVSPIDG